MNVLRLVQRELPKIVDKNSFIDMRKLKWVFFYFIYIYICIWLKATLKLFYQSSISVGTFKCEICISI